MKGPEILETKRLRLRWLEDSDLSRLHEIPSDERVMRFIDKLRPYTLEETARALKRAKEHYATDGLGPWAFIEKTTGIIAGYGGLENLPGREIPEVTYIFAPEYWGRGVATELANACLELGFERLQFDRIGASVDPDNEASIRILEKLGMRLAGEGADEFGLPALFYEVFPSDWAGAVPESL